MQKNDVCLPEKQWTNDVKAQGENEQKKTPNKQDLRRARSRSEFISRGILWKNNTRKPKMSELSKKKSYLTMGKNFNFHYYCLYHCFNFKLSIQNSCCQSLFFNTNVHGQYFWLTKKNNTIKFTNKYS